MKHVFVKPDLNVEPLEEASLTISAELTNHSKADVECTIRGSIEDIMFSQDISLESGETRKVFFNPEDFPELNIKNPRIWWPNHLGTRNCIQWK